MTLALVYPHNFTRITSRRGDTLQLEYDLDAQRWPWLCLPPQHPIIVEKYQYFSVVTAGQQLLEVAPGSFSALTRLEWQCPPDSEYADHAPHGSCRVWQQGRRAGFELNTLAADGTCHVRATGEGHAFVNRDFTAWRAASKAALAHLRKARLPVLAKFASSAYPSLISPLDAAGQSVSALVTAQEGFYPAHPFHTGSGDHVNAAQLLDCCLQMLALLRGPAGDDRVSGGALQFHRFVELDVPFTVKLKRRESLEQGGERWCFVLGQAGQLNADIALVSS